MAKVLFIVAGYSGVGKSTAIDICLKNKYPLFGNKINSVFSEFNPSKSDALWMTPLEELIKNKSCLPGIYLEKINANYPDHLLVHIDLLTVQITLQGWPKRSDLNEMRRYYPRNFDSLINYEINYDIFNKFLTSDIFKTYDSLYVNTVIAPYETVCDRWSKRAQKRQTVSGRSFYYKKDRAGKKIFQVIHETWFNNLKDIGCTNSYITKMSNSKMEIKKYKDEFNSCS